MDETKAGQEAGTPRAPAMAALLAHVGDCEICGKWPSCPMCGQTWFSKGMRACRKGERLADAARREHAQTRPVRATAPVAASSGLTPITAIAFLRSCVRSGESLSPDDDRAIDAVLAGLRLAPGQPPARPPTTDGSVSMAGKEK